MMDNCREIRKVTWIGLLVNLVLSGIKFAGGIFGHSQALVADGVHNLSDLSTDLTIILGSNYWNREADTDHPHGHKKIETLVTLFIGLMLAGAAIGIFAHAVLTIQEPHERPPEKFVIAMAAVAIFVKEGLFRWTFSWGHKLKSMPLMANAWHHRSDALSSIPVFLAVTGILINPRWIILDHIGAVAVAIFISQAAWKIAKPAFSKLIDASVSTREQAAFQQLAQAIPGVENVHKLRSRYLGCTDVAVDLHVLVKADISVKAGHDISENIQQKLMQEFPNIIDVVVHVEPLIELGEKSDV